MTLFEELASLLSQTDVSALGSIGLVVVVIAASALVRVWRRLSGRSERADVAMWEAEVCAHIGHQAYAPELDEGTDRLLADLHDVFKEGRDD